MCESNCCPACGFVLQSWTLTEILDRAGIQGGIGGEFLGADGEPVFLFCSVCNMFWPETPEETALLQFFLG